MKNLLGCWVRTRKEKAEVFAHHVENTLTSHVDETVDEVENYVNALLEMTLLIHNININKTKDEINSLNNQRRLSNGYDSIKATALRQLKKERRN